MLVNEMYTMFLNIIKIILKKKIVKYGFSNFIITRELIKIHISRLQT